MSARVALRTLLAYRVTYSNLASGSPPTAAPLLDPWLGITLAFLLVLLNGFFVAAEFALVKVRPTQIEAHVVRGEARGRLAEHMLKHLDSYLSATQLGITLASLALGWIGEPAFAWLLNPVVNALGVRPSVAHSISLTTAFVTITVLHIVLGEQAPKSFAIRKAEATSLWVSIPLFSFYKLTYPVIWLLNHAANGLLRAIGMRPVSEQEVIHGEEELRLLLGSRRTAKLSRMKRELLDNIFELSHRNARQIMVPRADVVHLSLSRSLVDNLEIARQSGHTRFPLCKEQLDDIIGLVHIKDLFRSDHPVSSLQEIVREMPFVPETLAVDRLLRRMLQRKRHMAAVVDEYGGVSGIVTLENVIEEIVGPIQDEFDLERPELVRQGDHRFMVSGGMLVKDLESELKLEFSLRDEDTVAGLVLSELGRAPKVGDRVCVGPLDLEVQDVQRRRIRSLLVTVRGAASLEEPASEDGGSE